MQDTNQPRCQCIELIRKLNVGAFIPCKGTLDLVPKIGIRRATTKAMYFEPLTRFQDRGPTNR